MWKESLLMQVSVYYIKNLSFEHCYHVSRMQTQVEPAEGAGAARKSPSNSAELANVVVTAVSTGSWNK